MRTSAQKAIIYDDNCPMCALYTQGFVKLDVLRPENRVAFRNLGEQNLADQIDLFRARHEIPLVDLAGGPTLYGVDAMLCLIAQRIPLFGHLVHCQPAYQFFKRLYSLVSYNRRIIIPARLEGAPDTQTPIGANTPAFDCTPVFHRTYRLAFIAFAIVFSSLVTYAFGESLNRYLSEPNGGWKMLLIAGTGWVVQMLLAGIFLKENKIDYWGHLGVLMVLGVLILLPGIWLTHFFGPQSPWLSILSVVLSSSTMLWQHTRRIILLGLSQWWSFVWLIALQGTAAFWIYTFYLN